MNAYRQEMELTVESKGGTGIFLVPCAKVTAGGNTLLCCTISYSSAGKQKAGHHSTYTLTVKV